MAVELNPELNALAKSIAEGTISNTYRSLPTIDVSPTDLVMQVLEKTQANPAAAGSMLQTDGTPVAVLFDIKQYGAVQKVLNFIPNMLKEFQTMVETQLIPNMTKNLKKQAETDCKAELNKVGAELLKACTPLKKALYMMAGGALAIICGLYLMRIASQMRRKERLDESQYDTPSERTVHQLKSTTQKRSNPGLVGKVAGGITVIVGVGLLASSMLLTHRVSTNCLALASKLRA